MSSSPRAVPQDPDSQKPRLHSNNTDRAAKARAAEAGVFYVALTGNPNCGKTTVFNALTGLRAKIGNYAGVTVERKEGWLLGAPATTKIRVLDLPGTYSLSPQSLDEQVSRDVLLNRLAELPAPSAIVVVIDASNLQRNLYYATQVIELGHPTVIALNMMDVAESQGQKIDVPTLEQSLGVAIVPLVASTSQGISDLKKRIIGLVQEPAGPEARRFYKLPETLDGAVNALSEHLAEVFHERKTQAKAEALLLLSNEKALASSGKHYPEKIRELVDAQRLELEQEGIDWRSIAIEARYAAVAAIQREATTETSAPSDTLSDKLDRVLTHKHWGTLIFALVMALMFQSIFTLARLPMEALQHGVNWLGSMVGRIIPPGDLNSLLVDGVIAGVGSVVVFLPQILLLFLFIGFLEDTGYMARAAFIMDRLMSKVGLHGKSFIPMLSSFACAIPGIMATRTIESPKDRMATILISPLMSCSARLPVYTLLIAATIPNITVGGFLKLSGLTMLAMYLLGICAALVMAWLLKKTLLKGETPLLILELPPYKRPLVRVIFRHMWDRSKIFLRQAGTVILAINIVLWFLATYPHGHPPQPGANIAAEPTASSPGSSTQPTQEPAQKAPDAAYRLEHSFAGMLGKLIEPVIQPLGFDWKIGIGIISSFAAREVFVSTMSIVYNVGDYKASASGLTDLVKTMQLQKRPDGQPVYSVLTGLTLMVFYVFALQCVSTIAIVRRETNSWKWPTIQWAYMGALAWGMAFLTRMLGKMLGLS